MIKPPRLIAIDGPSAAGKGTLARRLAKHFGYAHLDSGMLYRAVASRVLQRGADPADAVIAEQESKILVPQDLSRPDLRSEAVAQAASAVAAIPAVRSALLAWQQDFALHPPGGAPGAVLDGRDIGTVVCPGAPVKLFVTASAQARAQRRHLELQRRGYDSCLDDVLKEMIARDARDSSRPVSPLVPAPDAVIIDTSDMGPDAVFDRALEIVLQTAHAR